MGTDPNTQETADAFAHGPVAKEVLMELLGEGDR